ncbi:MAG: recombinase family protein, partial [Frankiaceae bacterium]|nr:recombinase family protein [Frankiaceae bacterium]MBV9368617.1 recombinase family protein [Frankiales bacterium]
LRVVALHQSGASPASIASALNREEFRTPQGQRWHARTVETVLRRLDTFSLTS